MKCFFFLNYFNKIRNFCWSLHEELTLLMPVNSPSDCFPREIALNILTSRTTFQPIKLHYPHPKNNKLQYPLKKLYLRLWLSCSSFLWFNATRRHMHRHMSPTFVHHLQLFHGTLHENRELTYHGRKNHIHFPNGLSPSSDYIWLLSVIMPVHVFHVEMPLYQ